MPDIFDELAKQAGAAVAEPPAGEKPRDVFDVLASQAQPPATSPQADPQAAQRFLLQRGNQLAQDLAEGQRQDAADAALLAGTVTPVPLDRIGPAAAPRPYQPPVMRAATPQDIAYQQSSRGQDEAAFLRYVQNLSQTNPEAAARFFDDAGNLIRRGTPTVADDLERGLRNLQLIGLNAARGVADVAGVKTPGLDQEVGRVAMIQQKNPVLVDSLNEVSTAENGPAALLSFAVRNVLEQAALMGPGMTTSQAGGLLAQQLLARKVATLAGEEAARKMGMAYAKGAAAGALAGSAGVEFGSIYGDMADQGLRGRQQALVAGIASLPTGALDAVGSYLGVRRMAGNAADPFAERIINRMFGPGSAKTRAGKLASGMTEQLTVEPATEYVQTVLEQAAVISQDPEKQSRFIQESLSAESLNNALKAAQGAFFGAGGIGAITAIPDLIRRRKPARTEGGVDSSALNPVRQVPPLADLPGKALIPVLDDNNNVVAFKIPPAGTAPTGPGAAPKIAPAGAGQPNVTGSGSSATSVGAKGQEASAEKTLDDEVMDLLTGEAGILPAKDAKGREIADATTGGVTAAVEVAGENPTQTQPSAATPGVIPGSTAPKPGSTPATPAATAGAVTPTTAPVSEGPQKAAPSTLEPGAATATAESIRNQPLAFGAKVILPDGRTGTLKAYQQDGRQAVVAIVTPDGMTSDVKNDVKVLSRDLKSATVGAASPTTAPATAPASPIVKGTERFRAVVEEGGVSVAYDPDKLSQDDVRRAIANGRVGELYDTGDAIPAEQSQGVLKAAVQRGLESSRALNEKNKAATVTEIGDDGQPVVIAKPAPLGGGVDIGAALKTGTGKPLTEEQRNAVSGQRSTREINTRALSEQRPTETQEEKAAREEGLEKLLEEMRAKSTPKDQQATPPAPDTPANRRAFLDERRAQLNSGERAVDALDVARELTQGGRKFKTPRQWGGYSREGRLKIGRAQEEVVNAVGAESGLPKWAQKMFSPDGTISLEDGARDLDAAYNRGAGGGEHVETGDRVTGPNEFLDAFNKAVTDHEAAYNQWRKDKTDPYAGMSPVDAMGARLADEQERAAKRAKRQEAKARRAAEKTELPTGGGGGTLTKGQSHANPQTVTSPDAARRERGGVPSQRGAAPEGRPQPEGSAGSGSVGGPQRAEAGTGRSGGGVEQRAEGSGQGTAVEKWARAASNDDLVRACYAGTDARRKLNDLRPVIYDSVFKFGETGRPWTAKEITAWLEETGRGIGAVDSEVKEILSHAKDFEAVTRETEAIKEQNRRSNGGKREEAKPAEAGTPTPKPRYKAQGDMFAGGAGQPKPTAAMTLPELKKEAARGGADVSALDRAGLIRAIREQRKKSQPVEPLPVEAAAPAHEVAEEPADKPTRSKQVADFGEKIGGARKDMAQKTGPREDKPKGEKSDQPGWRRRYEVREEEKRAYWSGKSERKTGKWTVFDKIKERQRGTYDTKAEAEEAIPLLEATRNHRVGGIRNRQTGETSWAIFRKVGEHKRPIVKRGFATEEEAQKYLATHPVEIIEHKFQFPTVPWLDRINREGPEVRKGDVTTRMFQETFGFRGGEFGNWNMGHEGQQALNHAYDALMDMARALGVSPKELSLHGRLGIAFGARGHGGKDSASAHYERDRQVFNLTKIRGAGSVAHEWMHALDNFLADYPNYGKSDNTGMASVGKPSAALREKVRKAFDAVVKATTVSVTTEPISAEVALKNKERMEIHIREALKDIRQNFMAYGRYKNRPEPTAEQQKAFDALAERIIAGDVGKREWVPTSEKGFNGRYSYRRVLELNEIYKKAVGSSFAKQDSHTEGRLVASIMDMERTKQRVAAAAAGETEQRTKRTQYLDDARDIDAMRAEDYWSLPEEMTARAFAAYVDDKLGPETSQYLVHAADNKYYTWPEVTKPYPEGAERTEINRKFDALFDLLRQEGSELRIKEVQAEVDKTLGKGAMKAVLMEDVPPGVRKQLADQGTDRPRAFYVEGDGLYVVVENLPQDRPLAQALRESFQHETMHGLRDVLGKERYNDLLRAVQNGLRAEDVAWVMKRYTLKTPENPKGLDALGVVDEALGKMAEDVKGVQENSRLKRIWQRACYEVRLALMKVFNKFGLTWKWLKLSENDLRVMLRKSIEGRARSEASGAWNGTAEVRAQAQAAKDPEQAKAAARRVEVDTRIFSKDLDRFEARAIEPRQILNVGRPSDVLQKLGAENLLMVMRQDVADKVLHGKQDRPGLSKEALAKLPVELDAPVMAFDSSDQRKSLVLLTSLVDAKGQPVIGAIHLSKVLGRVEVNDIASLYGKDDLRWFLEQVGEGRLRYYDRKKLIAWQRSNRLEMPNEMPTQSASGHKVLTDADVVKAEDAKAVSPSPAQEESSAAGPTVRAQAREAGPEFRVVKRGGQWIVEDRDGNEIERHATAKEARDAVWSKNIERQGAGSREQGAETEPELPPSKEEARQEVRADAVGNAGTATGSGGDMAAALAAQDRLTAAEQVAKSRADVGHIGKDWRDVYRFWRKSVTDKLKAAGGRIAAELEPAVQKFFDVKEDRAGHYGNMAERPSRELSKKENAQALAEFHDWMAMAQITPEQMTGPVQEWLKSHGLDGMTPKSIRALSSRSGQLLMDNARAVLDAMGKETEQRGLLLLDGRTGEWVRFKARENYWPHGLRPEVDEVLRDPNREFHGPGAKKRAAEWKARYENVVSQIERHIAERWSTRASVAVETLAAEPGAADILDGPKSAERDKLVARLVAKFNRPGLDTSERLADAYFASVEGRRAMDRLRANLNERPGADRTAEDIAAHRQTILDEIGEGLTRKLLALDKADLRDDVTDAISTPEMKKELAAGSPDRSKAALVAAAKRMGYKLGKTSLAKIDDVLRDGQNLTALAMPESNPEAYRGVIGVLADILEASRGTGGEDRLGARIRKALDTEATQRAMEGGDTAAASKRMAVEAQRLALQRSQKLINQALDGVDSEGNPIMRGGEEVPKGLAGLRNSLVPMDPEKAKRLAVGAIQEWTEGPLSQRRADDQNSNIERGRVGGIPPHLINYRYEEVLPSYVNRWARRVAEVEAFGQGVTKETPDLFDRIAAQADPETKQWLADYKADLFRLRRETQAEQMLRWWQSYTAVAKLGTGNVFGTIKNFTQFLNAASHLGPRAAWNELMELNKLAAEFNLAREIGVLRNDLLGGYIEMRDIADRAQRVTRAGMNTSGWTLGEETSRVLAVGFARHAKRLMLKSIAEKPASLEAARAKAFFREHGVDWQKLAAEGEEIGPETRKWLRAAEREPMFSYDDRMVSAWANKPMGRFFFQFQKYLLQMSRFTEKWVLRPAFKGYELKPEEMPSARSQLGAGLFMRGNRLHDVRPLLFFAAVIGGSEALMALRGLLYGKDRPDPPWDEIARTWDEKKARASELAMTRLLRDLLWNGGLGWLGSIAENVGNASDRVRARSPLDPPAWSTLRNIFEQIALRTWQQKRFTPDQIGDLLLNEYPGLNYGWSALKTMGVALGADYGPAHYEAARRDVSALKRASRRYADEAGFETPNRVTGERTYSEHSPELTALYEAVVTGNTAKAKQTLDALLTTGKDFDEKKRLLSSARSMIAARQPFRLGGLAPEDAREYKQDFKAWLEKRAPDLAGVLERTQATYLDTAHAVGLAGDRREMELADRVRSLTEGMGKRGLMDAALRTAATRQGLTAEQAAKALEDAKLKRLLGGGSEPLGQWRAMALDGKLDGAGISLLLRSSESRIKLAQIYSNTSLTSAQRQEAVNLLGRETFLRHLDAMTSHRPITLKEIMAAAGKN